MPQAPVWVSTPSRKIETAKQASRLGAAVGTVVYLVELGDGSSIEIPEEFLEVANDGEGVPDEE